MIAGHGTPDQAPARLFSYRHPAAFARLLSLIADHSAEYLIRQIEAGADAVQIFNSWAGRARRGVVRSALRASRWRGSSARFAQVYPDVPIIGFPRGARARSTRTIASETGVTALGLDWTVPLSQAARLQESGAVQGNLDPLRLVAGGKALGEMGSMRYCGRWAMAR